MRDDDELKFPLQIEQNWFRVLGTFQHRMNQFHESGILGFLQTTQQSIFHHSNKLAIAQLIVHCELNKKNLLNRLLHGLDLTKLTVFIENGEHNIDYMIG